MAQPTAPAPSGRAGEAPLPVGPEQIRRLDLSPLQDLATLDGAALLHLGGTVRLQLEWPRSPDDPRELSEVPEVRLWALRADATYPWLPLLLDRASGELTRHVAMLLPHGFSRHEGIRFAPESLELWMTHRLFHLDDWARRQGLNCRQGLGQMAAVLGFELDPGFWDPLPPA